MKLIFLYGPPASGKLTVAEKLSELTGIPIFHNHLSRDIVKEIYGDKLSENYGLVSKIRLDVIEYCAEHNTDLMFTYVYTGADDDEDIGSFVRAVEQRGGEVIFVEITANKRILLPVQITNRAKGSRSSLTR